MDLHILTPHGSVLVAQVVDGKLVIPTFSEVIPPEFTVAPVVSLPPSE